MIVPRRARAAIVLVAALITQAALVPQVAIRGRVIDVLLLVTICAGIVGGPDRGAAVGFVAGVGTDLIVQTPFGMWALVGAVSGYVVGSMYSRYILGGTLMRVLTIGIALASATMFYVVLGRLIGQSFLGDISVVPVLLTVAIGGMILSPVALRVTAWGLGFDRMPWDHGQQAG